ncbi:hypothetical protein AFLA_008565 [Aspergillus flavus NRRL3357]|nr:hypothetical protein AFLA_008565 [Aspergillus flavus NRRL3357]
MQFPALLYLYSLSLLCHVETRTWCYQAILFAIRAITKTCRRAVEAGPLHQSLAIILYSFRLSSQLRN